MVLGEKGDGRIDREKTCPLLLRMFYNYCEHHKAADYSRRSFPSNELQVYTWLDATLLELSALVKQVTVEARRPGTSFDFSIVAPDAHSPGYRMRDIGCVCSGAPSDTDKIMIKDCSFHIGDMIDVAITPPLVLHNGIMGATSVRRVVRRYPYDQAPFPPPGASTDQHSGAVPSRRCFDRDHWRSPPEGNSMRRVAH